MTLFFLEDAEIEAVRWALTNYLPELRYEAARIKRERDRHELALREEVLTSLLERLNAEHPSQSDTPLSPT